MQFQVDNLLALEAVVRALREQFRLKGALTVRINGRRRSLAQNALAWALYGAVAYTREDCSVEDVHAEAALHLAVPILRSDDAEFCAAYDHAIRSLPYEVKLEAIRYWPTTSLMSKDQMGRYLDAMIVYFGKQGIVLGGQ